MKEQEPILADELSRRITAEMQGQTQPPVSEAIQPEAELAAKLISLSNDTHPDPDFVAALGSQLARRAAQKARQQNKPAPPERPRRREPPEPCGLRSARRVPPAALRR